MNVRRLNPLRQISFLERYGIITLGIFFNGYRVLFFLVPAISHRRRFWIRAYFKPVFHHPDWAIVS